MDIIKIAFIVLLAELPCIMRTTALQLSSGKMWSVIWGTLLGSVIALFFGLLLARAGKGLINEEWVGGISGSILILIGIYILFVE